MRWNEKVKRITKVEPEIGDFKRCVWFSLFPVKVANEWLWMEKYIKVYEFTNQSETVEHAVTSGGLEDAATFLGLLNERSITKRYHYQGWEFHSRELIT